jgi:tripartite-type tricarboxylate transporter receptor subunit TctC
MPKIEPIGRRTLVVAALAAAFPSLAQSQEFPARPVRLVTPYPPGGSTDLLARSVAASMSKSLGQQVIVDTKAGAGGILAAQETAKAAPDGYTFLLVAAGIVTMNQSIYKKLPYDPAKDFAPLTIAVRMPLLVVSNPSRPFKTIEELVAYAKANPGKLSYGSAGTGTSQHLAGELFKSMAKVDILHVPYKGGAPAMTDLIGGQVDLMFVQRPSAVPQVKAGRIRALATGSATRNSLTPDLPTVAESGLPGYDSDTWYGFVVPAGVPAPIAAKLHGAVKAALVENADALANDGFTLEAGTQKAMEETMRAESAKWASVIKAAKIEQN